MATKEIAEFNEDIDGKCTYCLAEDANIENLIWECQFFHKVRKEHDPKLAAIPTKYLLQSIRRGIAPAMKVDGSKSFWGQNLDDDITEDQRVQLRMNTI